MLQQENNMKRTFTLTLLSLALTSSFAYASDIVKPKTESVATDKAAKKDEYKVKLYQVPFNELGVNSQDPRYNQKAKMYFALNEKGYYPLMNMLISSQDRNPFTATQLLAGYGYVNQWKLDDKNALATLNKLVGINVPYTEATIETDISSYLLKIKQNLTGLYYTTKLLDEWQKQAPEEGYERVHSQTLKMMQYFDEVVSRSQDAKTKELSDKVYSLAMSQLPKHLLGNLDIQFYMKSILFKDEMLRQLTEVALLNTLNPQDIGQVSFVADILISGMQEHQIPVLLNKYYGKNQERNKGISFSDVDYSGVYERVYGNDEASSKAFGINRQLTIKPSSNSLKTLDFELLNGNDTLNLKAQLNPNGRGLDVFDNNPYYIEYTKDKKYIVMYANPSEGDAQRFIFKKVDKSIGEYNQNSNELIKNANQYVEKSTGEPIVNIENVTITSPAKAWHKLVGDDFSMSLAELEDAKSTWKEQNFFYMMPSTKQCGFDNFMQEGCKHRIYRFVIENTGKCEAYNVPNLGSTSLNLSKGVKGKLYFASETDVTTKDAVLQVVLKTKDAKSICMTSFFDTTGYPSNVYEDVVSFNNLLINQYTDTGVANNEK